MPVNLRNKGKLKGLEPINDFHESAKNLSFLVDVDVS